MESLPGAVSLARALLALERAHATGVLTIRAERGLCRLAVVDGVPRAAAGSLGGQPALGEALIDAGALDATEHARHLHGVAQAGRPVGAWLVGQGLCTRGAVESALRAQLRARVRCVFEARGVEYSFEPGSAEVGVEWIVEPVAAQDLVLSAMRELLRPWTTARLAAEIEGGPMRLGALGHTLLRGASLWPEEAAARTLLAEGTELPTLVEATRGSVRALRLVAVLALLGAFDDANERPSYRLLLRKRRQLRDDAGAHALLDTAPGASPGDARRALRRLAREIHPDRFAGHAPPAVVDASQAVMGALAGAERDVAGKN